jgi:hypothetical protein
MSESLEQILVSVWRQAMVEDVKTVTVNGQDYPVRQTSRSTLREVDFVFEGQTLRGLEQNPNTSSRWARLAREDKKVMQFLSGAGTSQTSWMAECTFIDAGAHEQRGPTFAGHR